MRDSHRKAGTNWWEKNPLIYDGWGRDPILAEPGTQEYFAEIDRRLFDAAEFATDDEGKPFGALIPYECLRGRRVLDLGCGSGVHTGLLSKCGAQVTACDLTEQATRTTRQRMAATGLRSDVVRGDARGLPFGNDVFDFVWSWGVIHHSPRMDLCVGEIARVLRSGGEARVMVYNRDSLGYWVNIIFVKGLLQGGLARRSVTDLANEHMDGHVATFSTRRGVRNLFRRWFEGVDVHVYGQRSEALPLPGRLRKAILPFVPKRLNHAVLRGVGAFLFVIAKKG